MKKLLFASSALVLSSNVASADIALTGTAVAGIQYSSSLSPTYEVIQDVGFTITGSGSTDSGLTFGASLDVTSKSGNSEYEEDRSLVYISSAFGTLSFGDVSNGGDVGGIRQLGFQADNPTMRNAFRQISRFQNLYWYRYDFFRVAQAEHDVHFKTTFGDVTLTASGIIGQKPDEYGLGLVYESGGYSVALGRFNSLYSGILFKHSRITLGGTFDDFAVRVFYNKEEHEEEPYEYDSHVTAAFELDYSIGATTLTFQIVGNNFGPSGMRLEPAYAVGFTHDLGGGASLKGVLARNNYRSALNPHEREIIADLGVTMSF